MQRLAKQIQFFVNLRDGFGWNTASVQLNQTLACHSAGLVSPFDAADINRRHSKYRIFSRVQQRYIFLIDSIDKTGGHFDGVDAVFLIASMNLVPFDLDVNPLQTLVTDGNLHIRRFSHDSALTNRAIVDQIFYASALLLFIGKAGKDHIARQSDSCTPKSDENGHHRRHRTFHIAGSSSIDFTFCNAPTESIRHVVGRHCVDVTREHQRSALSAACNSAIYIISAWFDFH